ncbi:MAG: winged helix-turn-helix transcriptional regulator [Anaerolineae bacterium]|jgi:DNA-binding MarR family transcriptional regulator|nr:winged helix-turn-helix transcriptional regulator [Anaerolineae bacterium]
MSSPNNHDLVILEKLEQDPESSQASLAAQLGVAVGTVNWHLKRLISKGYVKVSRLERRKLRYIITPEGMTLRAQMTMDYIQNSFRLYRLIRERVLAAVLEVRAAGYEQIRLEADGDIGEVCQLTCLEQGVEIVEDENAPTMRLVGLKLFVEFPIASSKGED